MCIRDRGCAAEYRHNPAGDCGAPEDVPDFVGGQVAGFKKSLEQGVVLLRAFFDQIRMPFARLFQFVGGDVLHAKFQGFVGVVIDGFHGCLLYTSWFMMGGNDVRHEICLMHVIAMVHAARQLQI